jgi:hypothetical protein
VELIDYFSLLKEEEEKQKKEIEASKRKKDTWSSFS